jgi:protocatechuate 3,4-dioxygenase beta subunit
MQKIILFICTLLNTAFKTSIMKRLFGMHHTITLLMLFLTCNGPQILANIGQEKYCNKLTPGEKGCIQLAKKEEPGEPLVIYGKIIDAKTNQPINDASLFLYQTDSSGIYSASGGPDNKAKIRGTLHTNESGCFKIKTILPGDYPGQKNSRHLHYVINAKGYKEKKSILFFKGFTTPDITSQGPFLVLDIKKQKDGSWIGTTDINMERTDSSTR